MLFPSWRGVGIVAVTSLVVSLYVLFLALLCHDEDEEDEEERTA